MHRSVEAVKRHIKRLRASGSCLHDTQHSRAQDQAGACILHWDGGVQDEWQLPGAALLSKAEQMSEVPGELTPSGVCKAHQLFAGATLLLRYQSFDSCYQGCHKALLRQMLVCSTIGAHPMSCFASQHKLLQHFAGDDLSSAVFSWHSLHCGFTKCTSTLCSMLLLPDMLYVNVFQSALTVQAVFQARQGGDSAC